MDDYFGSVRVLYDLFSESFNHDFSIANGIEFMCCESDLV